MAYAPFRILFLLVLYFPIFALSQNSSNLLVGSSLTATEGAKPWLSPSSDFAFGFQQMQGDKDQFLLSIWYNNIPDKTIVWYGNDGNTVKKGFKVELTADRGLVLTDSEGKESWSSGPAQSEVSRGILDDTGNFMIFNRGSTVLWDSFSNPTDTLLPTQTMEKNGTLYSRLTETDFSRGRFKLRFYTDGDLVLNARDLVTDNSYKSYYQSRTSDENESNQGYQVNYSTTGYISIVRRNGATVNLAPKGEIPPPGNYYHRITLNYDGVLGQYYHPKNFTDTSAWTAVWQLPEDICSAFWDNGGSGACGYNSICRLDDSKRAHCECPQTYTLLDPNDNHSSCKPNFTQYCDDNDSGKDLYDFVVITNTDWPQSDYAQLKPISEDNCRKQCSDDCFCAAAIYRNNTCWKKKLPLSYGRIDNAAKAFLKYSKGDPETQGGPTYEGKKKKKDTHTLVLVGSVLLGSSVFVNILFTVVACFGFFYIYPKRIVNLQPADNSVETNVRRFTCHELIEATNGFKEELGRGAFGIVYKGVIQMSTTTILVAIKKIDRLDQDGLREFKTEVNVIAQTHHRNLVRLVGFCEEGEHRLLVYEYMVNGSLASFIFGSVKPSWALRIHIALGIAKGLAYLHNECNTQIIHCDIKPQNILVDEYYNARISDFGLAKLLMLNQSRTNTGIRGTKGYVAPEWFRNTPITVKVDVYSFGVLLLEIICCRRSVEGPELGENAILVDWVWDCFLDDRMVDLIKNDQEDVLSDWEKVEIFVKVGLWCIQEDPTLRPTMSKVIQMLEGDVDVPDPPCPPDTYTKTI